ncbi:MAG: FeoB-associated Cys-rich membrane protein [Oscillospiraceae bacterium]|nr:FeoB-associated Cys-rich membrane protein [Oscillospiraceae bacterium]
MFSWIAANSGDIIVLFVLALIVAAVIAGMIRDKKKGKHCSGCSGCSSCASCGSCSRGCLNK